MNSINKHSSLEEQLKSLENRNLIFKNERSKDIFKLYLSQYSYEILIDEYSFNEFFIEDEINFSESICSDDIRYIFDIDRTISSILWKYFKGIELSLNSIIKDILCLAFEDNSTPPYISLLDNNLSRSIFSNYNSTNYNKNTDSFEIKKILYKYASRDKTLNKILIRNKEFEFDETKTLIGEAVKKISDNSLIKRYSFIQIQKLASIWTFSSLVNIYKILDDKYQKEVEEKFFKYGANSNLKTDFKSFYDLLEIFSDLRNKLAHNVKIIDFKIKVNSEELAKKISNIINEEVYCGNNYNLSILIKIIQRILNMDNNKIEEEIKDYINNKFKKSKEKRSPLIDKIIKNYLDIEL